MAAIRAAVGEQARPSDDGAAALGVSPRKIHMVDDGLVVRERMARLKAAVGDKTKPFAAPHAARQPPEVRSSCGDECHA
jgi:hypothetical protein